MGDIPGLVKISVSLKIQPNDGAVYFKVDGQRFGQNRTIKLLTGAKYKIEVALRPGTVQATTMGIGGVNVPLEEKSRDAQVASYTGIYDTEGVPHTKSGERQPIQVNMQGILWTSGDSHQGPWLGIQSQALGIQGPSFCLPALPGFLEQSMPQTQGVTTFPFHLSSAGCLGTCQRLKACFNDIGVFETVWQVKFYNYHKRDHCQWGNSFGSIEYECKPNETRSLMWINKETFH
ncbi:CB1 cannabinoid receptor-interacting protein 1 isoform X2 [Phalacrocorax carbo]|uniref:CB1 cannabinoid receptor-interacting protein 1 isoform X2 n=1 Tax=Phalacrocorax carbo TaxID=9209 RepID=UPI003119FFF4